MSFVGRSCTLYPVTWDGTAFGKAQVDYSAAAGIFQAELVRGLQVAGLDLRMPVPGTADQERVIRCRVTIADPGSQLQRYVVGFGAGGATFEVEVMVGTPAAPFATFRATGQRRWSALGGGDQMMINDSARLAGEDAARKAVAALASF